jgi:tetratricopeptide (TPR) repeat protein
MLNNICYMKNITISSALFLVLCHIATLTVFAQTNPPNVDWGKVHTTTMEAINSLYNLKYQEAEQRCNEVITMAPGDPRGHFIKGMAYFYKYRLQQNKADYNRFMQLTQNTIAVCENVLKSRPNDSQALFYMGGSYGYRGICRFFNPEERMKTITQSLWDGKKGYDYLNDAVKADPNNADAQMGFGLFNCLVAQAPAVIKPAIKLAGFTTDRNLGLKQLENAAVTGIYTRPEAQYWLSTFYQEMEETAPRAIYHLKNLTVQFPQNYWYKIVTGQILMNTLRKPEEAAQQFQAVVHLPDKTAQSQGNLLLGASQMYRLRFQEATQYLQKCIALGADSSNIRNALYIQGLMQDMDGNHAQAMQFYQKALPFRAAAELVQKPLTPELAALRRISVSFRGAEYVETVRLADELLKKQVAEDVRGQALYTSGRALAELGKGSEAEQRFLQALQVKPTEEKWITPSTHLRLAQVQSGLGKKTEAKQNLDYALAYKDYDNEDVVRRQANRELARLKKQ